MKPVEEMIIEGDFAENFLYVIQDKIQSFHWEKNRLQCINLWHITNLNLNYQSLPPKSGFQSES